ncbi:MAG: response regulator [Terriglobales bacterium]
MRGRLLLVDDDAALLETLAMVLSQHDFEVAAVETVPEALQAMAEKPFDLLLTDLSMPGDGFTVVREMHRMHPHAALLVLSGYMSAWQRAPADARGMVHEYIAKPADAGVLVQTLERCLSARSQATDSP